MPKTACREPMCPEFAEHLGRCTTHARRYRSETRDRTPGAAIYKTKKWKAVRRAVLRRDRYTCQDCKRFGNEVDHVVPIREDGAVWDQDNLQTLCKSCHSAKTAREVLGG